MENKPLQVTTAFNLKAFEAFIVRCVIFGGLMGWSLAHDKPFTMSIIGIIWSWIS